MKREYIGYFIVNGREMSRCKPTYYKAAVDWCMEKRRVYASYLVGKQFQLYLETESSMGFSARVRKRKPQWKQEILIN